MPIPIAEVQKMAAMCGNELHADPGSTSAREKLELLQEILFLHNEIAGTNPPDPIRVRDQQGDHVDTTADDVP
jgi:hypothetical protein